MFTWFFFTIYLTDMDLIYACWLYNNKEEHKKEKFQNEKKDKKELEVVLSWFW